MLPEKFIFIGVTINLFCSLWYIKSILKGNTKPNMVSWFIWMLAPFVGVFLQLKAGAGFSSLSVFMAGFGPFLVLAFSVWKREYFWKLEKFDFVCGFFSALALIFYILTKNPALSIIFAILSDGLAYIPTLAKTWKSPESESGSVYLGGIINNTISLFIIKDWSFAIYSFNIYLILINILEVAFIYRKKIFKIRNFS